MILANEHGGGAALDAAAARRSTASTSGPSPHSIELLLDQARRPRRADPARARALTPAQAASVAAAASERVAEYTRAAGRGREAFPALVLRALKQARYDPRNLGHSGLASPAYCHFTSPIRRYPDLVVHRALLRELGARDDADPGRPRRSWPSTISSASARPLPGRAPGRRHLPRLASRAPPFRAGLGGAVRRRDRRPDRLRPVRPLRRGLRGLRAGRAELPGDYFELNDLRPRSPAARGGGTYRLGDGIDVLVEKIEKTDGKVELSPAGRPPR